MDKAPLPEGVDPDTVYLDVTFGEGKYRVIYHMDAKKPEAFRLGVPHGPSRDHLSSNMVRALVDRVAELEEQAETLFVHCSINPLTDEGKAAYDAMHPATRETSR